MALQETERHVSPFEIQRATKGIGGVEIAVRTTEIIVDCVDKGTLPEGELPLEEGETYAGLRDTFSNHGYLADYHLTGELIKRRRRIIEGQVKDPNTHVFFAENDKVEFLATGSLQIRPKERHAWLFSFYVEPSYRGSGVACEILKKCMHTIREHEEQTGREITTISLGRYDLTEKRQPIMAKIARMVNREEPDTITTTEFNWRGSPGKYYHIPRNVFEDLVNELVPKYESLFLQ